MFFFISSRTIEIPLDDLLCYELKYRVAIRNKGILLRLVRTYERKEREKGRVDQKISFLSLHLNLGAGWRLNFTE